MMEGLFRVANVMQGLYVRAPVSLNPPALHSGLTIECLGRTALLRSQVVTIRCYEFHVCSRSDRNIEGESRQVSVLKGAGPARQTRPSMPWLLTRGESVYARKRSGWRDSPIPSDDFHNNHQSGNIA
ncbi:hypothetical protein bAD24_III11875 [Burkholderia sp. AD24]|nr:hypothetical protein bAD24_III11875 [Burkholderia sp. AD24]